MLSMAVAVNTIHVPVPARRKESMARDLVDGIAYVRGNSLFAFLMGMAFFNAFFGMAASHLMPVFAKEVLGVGPSGLGILFSISGLGSFIGVALVGSVFGEYERKGVMITLGGVAFGGCLIVFGLSTSFPLTALALFSMGAFNSVYMVLVQTTLQERVDDGFRGRVMGIFGMVHSLGPMGAIQAGALAEAVGPAAAVSIGGLAVIGFTLGSASSAEVRRLQTQPAAT
jgi:MFS family permease